MDFWSVLSCCVVAPTPSTRPTAPIKINGTPLLALFDTGSTITLVNSKYKTMILANSPISEEPQNFVGLTAFP